MIISVSEYGQYNYIPHVCHVNHSAKYVELFKNVSLETCKLACNQVVEKNCSGIFWNRLGGSCWLTSHTGDDQNDSNCESIRTEIIFFRRRRTPCNVISLNTTFNVFKKIVT